MMDTNNNENNSYDKNALLVYTPIRENMSFRIKNKKVQSLFCLNSSPSTIQKKKQKKSPLFKKNNLLKQSKRLERSSLSCCCSSESCCTLVASISITNVPRAPFLSESWCEYFEFQLYQLLKLEYCFNSKIPMLPLKYPAFVVAYSWFEILIILPKKITQKKKLTAHTFDPGNWMEVEVSKSRRQAETRTIFLCISSLAISAALSPLWSGCKASDLVAHRKGLMLW